MELIGSGSDKVIPVCKIQGLCCAGADPLVSNETFPDWNRPANTQPSGCGQLVSAALCALFSPQGKYILTPSPITYAEEQLFHFFGQLLGIAIRADVPLPLDLLPSFWKTLVGEPLDPDVDLQEADILTYNYVKKFENVGPVFLFPPFPRDSLMAQTCLLSLVAVRWFLWKQGWEMG